MYTSRSNGFIPQQWSSRQTPSFPCAVDTTHPLAANLIGYWLLNTDNSNDLSNTGTIGNTINNNSPTITSGLFGPSTSLNGTNQSIKTTNFVQPLSQFTVSFWAYTSADYFSSGFLAANSDTDFNNTGFKIFSSSGYVTFFAGNDSGWNQCYSNSNSFPAGIWFHIAGVYNGSTIYLYINAVKQSATAGLSGNVTGSYPLSFGYNPRTTSSFASVALSTSSIYARALSDSEIAWLYAEPFSMLKPLVRKSYLTNVLLTPASQFPPLLQPYDMIQLRM